MKYNIARKKLLRKPLSSRDVVTLEDFLNVSSGIRWRRKGIRVPNFVVLVFSVALSYSLYATLVYKHHIFLSYSLRASIISSADEARRTAEIMEKMG